MSSVMTHHHWLGVMIFMEIHRRVLHGEFGRMPKPLTEWAFAEGGYCIDAPQLMPAGGCYFLELEPPSGVKEPWGVPEQLTVERECQFV